MSLGLTGQQGGYFKYIATATISLLQRDYISYKANNIHTSAMIPEEKPEI